MHIKKDLQNVLLSFGAIIATLSVGSAVYDIQERSTLAESEVEPEAAQSELGRSRFEVQEGLDDDQIVRIGTTSSESIQEIASTSLTLDSGNSTETVSQALLPSQNVESVVTPADLAKIQAQITAAQQTIDKLAAVPSTKKVTTVSPTKNAASKVTTVKASRRSRAS